MNKKKVREQIWVSPEFKTEIYFIKAESPEKKLETITKEIAFELKQKRLNKDKERFKFL